MNTAESTIGFRSACEALAFCGSLLLAAAPAHAGDPVVLWPGSGTCAGTLQACIDSAGTGTDVRVDDAVSDIDESIVLDRSITLTSTGPLTPSFAPGRGIRGSFSGTQSVAIEVSGFAMTDAHVELTHSGTGSARFAVSRMRIDSSSGSQPAGIRLRLSGAATGTRELLVHENILNIAAPGLFDAGIEAQVRDAAAEVDIRWNRVEAVADGSGWGILSDNVAGANTAVTIFGNEVRGGFSRYGIGVSEGLFSSTASTIDAQVVSNVVVGGHNRRGGGLGLITNQGTIDAAVVNNTITFGRGLLITRWGGSAPPAVGTVTGSIFNNLVAYTIFGLQNTASTGGNANNNYNLLHGNNPAGSHTPGAQDVNAAPSLRSPLAPRLRENSPARNAGNGFALILTPNATLHDADGLRRLVGTVDIGAYEFGHRTVLAQNEGSAGSSYAVGDAQLTTDSTRKLFATENFSINNAFSGRPLDIFFFDQWFIGSANGSSFPSGAAANVFAPVGTSVSGLFTHVATGSNTLDGASQIDWSRINEEPEAFVLFTQATALGNTFNPDPVVLDYQGTRWGLVTANGNNFVTGAGGTRWNLYTQDRSPQAFVHEVTAGNLGPTGEATVIDHPRLNGVRCAQIQVSPLARSSVAGTVFDVEYRESRHAIFSYNGDIPIGARYHVLVLPEQIEDCNSGRLFSDGFEGFNY